MDVKERINMCLKGSKVETLETGRTFWTIGGDATRCLAGLEEK